MPHSELEGIINFLYEMGLLKRVKRAGWLLAGVSDPETIAEHTFRTALIGHVLALMEGADAGKTVILCLFHDTQETRTGDIPSVGKPYVTTAPHDEVTGQQVAEFPLPIADAIRRLIAEYEGRSSPEAVLARDADKLECLIQAREYHVQGYQDVSPWIETSLRALVSDSAQRLARECLRVQPRDWWKAFADAYPMKPPAAGLRDEAEHASESDAAHG